MRSFKGSYIGLHPFNPLRLMFSCWAACFFLCSTLRNLYQVDVADTRGARRVRPSERAKIAPCVSTRALHESVRYDGSGSATIRPATLIVRARIWWRNTPDTCAAARETHNAGSPPKWRAARSRVDDFLIRKTGWNHPLELPNTHSKYHNSCLMKYINITDPFFLNWMHFALIVCGE